MKKRIAARLGASAHAAQARDALQARAAAARARPGSQQASGGSQRKRGFERRRGLAHSGQRPRFAQKGRQRGGPRPGKARRWRAASTGGRHAGAVSTRTRRAALARASAPAGAGGAGSSSCMKTHHGQPAGADWASGWKGAPSWASPATATHSMPCAVHSSTRSPAAAFSRAGCAAAQSTSSAAASAQKRRAETGRRHSTPGRENARTVKKSPENCNKTWKKVAQCRGHARQKSSVRKLPASRPSAAFGTCSASGREGAARTSRSGRAFARLQSAQARASRAFRAFHACGAACTQASENAAARRWRCLQFS